MTRPIRFDPGAQRELNEAAEFYDLEDLGLGRAFLDAAERAFEQIRAFPESSQVCPVGRAAWDAGLPGIACRSATPAAPPGAEELARFGRGDPLAPLAVRSFPDWF